jgi:tetratricopeptide (TPR) repeat protein
MSGKEDPTRDWGIDSASPLAEPTAPKKKRKSGRLLPGLVAILFLAVIAMTGLLASSVLFGDGTPATKAERDLAVHQQLVREKPEDSERRVKLAAAYLQVGAPEAALREAELAMRHEVYSLDAYLVKATAYQHLGDLDQAQASYEALLELTPRDARSRVRLAELHLAENELAEAAAHLDLALEAQPRASDILALRGNVHEVEGEAEKARGLYEEALRYYPQYDRAVEGLARLDRGELLDLSLLAAGQSAGDDQEGR